MLVCKLTVTADVSPRLPHRRSSPATGADLIVIHREIPQNAKKPAGQRQPGGLSRLVSYEIMEAYFARDLRSPGPTSLAGRDTGFPGKEITGVQVV
jgi:hypothetical protein